MYDAECEDMIHNSNFHVNGDPVHCSVCFNTRCYKLVVPSPGSSPRCGNDCQSAWDACVAASDLPGEMSECPNDIEVGEDCGK